MFKIQKCYTRLCQVQNKIFFLAQKADGLSFISFYFQTIIEGIKVKKLDLLKNGFFRNYWCVLLYVVHKSHELYLATVRDYFWIEVKLLKLNNLMHRQFWKFFLFYYLLRCGCIISPISPAPSPCKNNLAHWLLSHSVLRVFYL